MIVAAPRKPGRPKRFTASECIRICSWLSQRGKEGSKGKLTWKEVEEVAGFSKMRLSREQAIVEAFHDAKAAVRTQGPQKRPSSNREEELAAKVEQLTDQIQGVTAERERWLLLWDRWQFNAHRMGWDVLELEKPLPRARHRKIARGSQ